MDNKDEFIALDKYTGEYVRYIRKKCRCGHSLYFLKNKPAICRYCGSTIYPTKICEFKEKLKKEIKKK